MVKNVKIKVLMKNTIFRALSLVNRVIPKDDKRVMLYSGNMGIRHNLLPLKKYLIERGYCKRYNIICAVDRHSEFEDDGLRYITHLKAVFEFFITRHVFYTTGQIPIKPSKRQVVIQMDHGTTGIKTGGLLTNINNGDDFYFSYYCAPSEAYREIVKAEFLCRDENIVLNSEPVTDVFFQQSPMQYKLGNFAKIGVWTPTFRQSDYLGYSDSSEEDLLPTLKYDDYEQFNEYLKEKNILIIAKLHDGQDLKKYKQTTFSNLWILSGKDFGKRGLDLYQLLKQTDFLIGDYSSVNYQYLLLDRPVAFTIPDIEDYRSKRGFVFEPVEEYMPGPKIKAKEELYEFLEDIIHEKDEYRDERKKINNIINHYQDGKSCERLIKFSEMR